MAAALPGLATFVQSALNNRSHTQQSEVEVLLDMCMQKDASPEPNWKSIEANAANEPGPCAKYCDVLGAVARRFPAECSRDLAAFYKACCGSGKDSKTTARFMGSEFLSRLAGLTFGKLDNFPWVLTAAWKANLLSADNKCTDGFCRLLTTSHLSSLAASASRESIQKMEKIMTSSRELVQRLQVPSAQAVKLLGLLDSRLMLHQLKLGKYADRQFKSADEIGQVV